jgi:hypothetical protein
LVCLSVCLSVSPHDKNFAYVEIALAQETRAWFVIQLVIINVSNFEPFTDWQIKVRKMNPERDATHNLCRLWEPKKMRLVKLKKLHHFKWVELEDKMNLKENETICDSLSQYV